MINIEHPCIGSTYPYMVCIWKYRERKEDIIYNYCLSDGNNGRS